MIQHKYIPNFNNWVKLNENEDIEQEISERADKLTQEFEETAAKGKIETSDLMIWFHGMMDLYDTTNFKGLVFRRMKPIWSKYFRMIYPILSTSNQELTTADVARIKKYKQISHEEISHERSAGDLLKELGLD
jgi:UDP-galactopyranose mutase